MNYLQAGWALERIVEFRDLYITLVKAHRSADTRSSWELQQQMARLAPDVQRDLNRVGIGTFLLQEAPAFGGRVTPVEVTHVAYTPELAADYHASERDILLMFERAIGEYLRLRRHAFRNLFNPFWWIGEILSGVVSLPFYLAGRAGFNQQAIQSSLAGRLFRILAELLIILAALAGIVQFLLDRGWLVLP